jgi:hypothetical protein
MRFRLGVITGFAAGYYLGAKAGRQRYEEINRAIDRLRGSDTFEAASDRARAVIDLGVERAKEAVEERLGGDDEQDASGNGMGAGAAPPFPNPRP